jgi:hypothetical protein
MDDRPLAAGDEIEDAVREYMLWIERYEYTCRFKNCTWAEFFTLNKVGW